MMDQSQRLRAAILFELYSPAPFIINEDCTAERSASSSQKTDEVEDERGIADGTNAHTGSCGKSAWRKDHVRGTFQPKLSCLAPLFGYMSTCTSRCACVFSRHVQTFWYTYVYNALCHDICAND